MNASHVLADRQQKVDLSSNLTRELAVVEIDTVSGGYARVVIYAVAYLASMMGNVASDYQQGRKDLS